MKNKIITGLMAFMITAAMPLTAFAATNEFTAPGNASIPVSCEVPTTYTVSLPAALTLEQNGDRSFTAHGEVKVRGDIPGNKRIIVVPTSGAMKDGQLTSESIKKGEDMVTAIEEQGYLDTLESDMYKTEIDFTDSKGNVVKGNLRQKVVSFRSYYATGGGSLAERNLYADQDLASDVWLDIEVPEPDLYQGYVVYTFRLAKN